MAGCVRLSAAITVIYANFTPVFAFERPNETILRRRTMRCELLPWRNGLLLLLLLLWQWWVVMLQQHLTAFDWWPCWRDDMSYDGLSTTVYRTKCLRAVRRFGTYSCKLCGLDWLSGNLSSLSVYVFVLHWLHMTPPVYGASSSDKRLACSQTERARFKRARSVCKHAPACMR